MNLKSTCFKNLKPLQKKISTKAENASKPNTWICFYTYSNSYYMCTRYMHYIHVKLRTQNKTLQTSYNILQLSLPHFPTFQQLAGLPKPSYPGQRPPSSTTSTSPAASSPRCKCAKMEAKMRKKRFVLMVFLRGKVARPVFGWVLRMHRRNCWNHRIHVRKKSRFLRGMPLICVEFVGFQPYRFSDMISCILCILPFPHHMRRLFLSAFFSSEVKN